MLDLEMIDLGESIPHILVNSMRRGEMCRGQTYIHC